MSTNISPQNRSRSKKIEGGRVQCIVYLPKDEVAQIDKVNRTGFVGDFLFKLGHLT